MLRVEMLRRIIRFGHSQSSFFVPVFNLSDSEQTPQTHTHIHTHTHTLSLPTLQPPHPLSTLRLSAMFSLTFVRVCLVRQPRLFCSPASSAAQVSNELLSPESDADTLSQEGTASKFRRWSKVVGKEEVALLLQPCGFCFLGSLDDSSQCFLFVYSSQHYMRLDRFLQVHLPELPFSQVQKLIRNKKVGSQCKRDKNGWGVACDWHEMTV